MEVRGLVEEGMVMENGGGEGGGGGGEGGVGGGDGLGGGNATFTRKPTQMNVSWSASQSPCWSVFDTTPAATFNVKHAKACTEVSTLQKLQYMSKLFCCHP